MDYGQIIRRVADGSYVINNGLYHVPNNDEYAEKWADVNAYALKHPDMVTDEQPYVQPEEERLAIEAAKAKAAAEAQRIPDVEDATIDLAEYIAELEERIAQLEANNG